MCPLQKGPFWTPPRWHRWLRCGRYRCAKVKLVPDLSSQTKKTVFPLQRSAESARGRARSAHIGAGGSKKVPKNSFFGTDFGHFFTNRRAVEKNARDAHEKGWDDHSCQSLGLTRDFWKPENFRPATEKHQLPPPQRPKGPSKWSQKALLKNHPKPPATGPRGRIGPESCKKINLRPQNRPICKKEQKAQNTIFHYRK